jgi:chromosome partitioning protein
MFDQHNRICHLILDQIQRDLSQRLFRPIIEVDPKLQESPAFGQPITQYAPQVRGAAQYRAVAQKIVDRYSPDVIRSPGSVAQRGLVS